MTIIEKSGEFDNITLYKLTKDRVSSPVSQSEGVQFTVKHWAEYSDVNKQGEVVNALALMSEDGEVFRTTSGTAIQSFKDIIECGIENPTIDIQSGSSKNGRTFYFFHLI